MSESLFSCAFQTLGRLSEGSFADVFKVQFEGHSEVYALKRLKRRFRTLNEVKCLPDVIYLQLKGHRTLSILLISTTTCRAVM
jgi:renal tumor antigen